MSATTLRQVRAHFVDRADLASLLSPPNHHGPWNCPHATTTRHATASPVDVFTTNSLGPQQWHCRDCGAGGTALDLLTANAAGAALDQLTTDLSQAFATVTRSQPRLARCANDYLDRCAALLWSEHGEPARIWLHQHGLLHDACLRANGIGFDPGANHLRRAAGLPRSGPAITVPLRDITLTNAPPTSLTTITIDATVPRSVNASRNLTTPSNVAGFVPAIGEHDDVIITDRVIDALSATTRGFRAIAIVDSAQVDPGTLDTVAAALRNSGHRAVICMSATPAGTLGAVIARDVLAEYCAVSELELPDHAANLNDWLRAQ